jgi:IS6 family transposase
VRTCQRLAWHLDRRLVTAFGQHGLLRWLMAETGAVTSSGSSSVFAGFRFPREVISVGVRWYLPYGLSYRDAGEPWPSLASPSIMSASTDGCSTSPPELIEAARPRRHAPDDRRFVDATYVKVAGEWTYLYRAVDQHGQVIDVLLSARRDLPAARRFFTRAMRAGTIPAEVTTTARPPAHGS